MFRAAFLSQLFLVASSFATALNFSATPSVLRAGATVSVSVTGLHDKKACAKGSCCWVGVYLVGEDVRSTQPIEYQPIRDNSDTLMFRVINFRSSFVFYLFEGQTISPNITVKACRPNILNTKAASHHHVDMHNMKIDSHPAVVLATSNTVQLEPSSLYAPHAIRVSHTSDPTTLSVGFTSHPASGQGVIQWGETLDKLTQSAVASGSEGDAYNATSLCGAPVRAILTRLTINHHFSNILYL